MPEENSIPALTHLQGGSDLERRLEVKLGVCENDCGAAPANMTSPPWSHSISQSAVTVTSATTKGCRREVKTIGAVDVSPLGGLRQRSVFGPAVNVKYSIYRGSVYSGGRFKVVNVDPSGGMFTLDVFVSAFQPYITIRGCDKVR